MGPDYVRHSLLTFLHAGHCGRKDSYVFGNQDPPPAAHAEQKHTRASVTPHTNTEDGLPPGRWWQAGQYWWWRVAHQCYRYGSMLAWEAAMASDPCCNA